MTLNAYESICIINVFQYIGYNEFVQFLYTDYKTFVGTLTIYEIKYSFRLIFLSSLFCMFENFKATSANILKF